MKRVAAFALILLALGGLLPALVVLADRHEPPQGYVVEEVTSVGESAEDHDLVVVSFGKLFDGEVKLGDTAALSFEIVNLGRLPNTGDWTVLSDNATPDTGDDVTVASGTVLLPSGYSVKTRPPGVWWDTTGANTGVHTLTLSVVPVPGEILTDSNTMTLTVAIYELPEVEEYVIQEADVFATAFTEDHDLAVVSFETVFIGSVISGETVAFSFEIVNQGLLPNTGDWRVVSDNATADTGDDITIASGTAPLPSGFSLKTGPGGIPWDTTGANTGDHAVTLAVAPVGDEIARGNDANNRKTLTVTAIEQPNVQVTAVIPTAADGITPIGTADVSSGTTVNVNVKTLNHRTAPVTFGLALTDVTDSVTVAELSVSLSGDQEVTLGFAWDTTDASSGDHTLTATATLTGDAHTGDNSMSTTVPVRIVTGIIIVQGADAVFPADPNRSPLVLQDPDIATVARPVTSLFLGKADAILTQILGRVEIATVVQPLTEFFLSNADGITDRTFGPVGIATVAQPLLTGDLTSDADPTLLSYCLTGDIPCTFAEFILREADATSSTALAAISVPTTTETLSELFISNADATLDVGRLRDPISGFATIRSGSVHLQGRDTSTGAFLLVGGQVHFVAVDGSFEFSVAPGTYDILITAPGYVYVALIHVTLNAGQELVVPELTLPFGDANGDGKVGVEDLGFLGASFGEEWREITP